jgi:hypothetical protein
MAEKAFGNSGQNPVMPFFRHGAMSESIPLLSEQRTTFARGEQPDILDLITFGLPAVNQSTLEVSAGSLGSAKSRSALMSNIAQFSN